MIAPKYLKRCGCCFLPTSMVHVSEGHSGDGRLCVNMI